MDTLTRDVIGAAIEVHRVLGPGLLESAYETCLAHELYVRNIGFVRQWPVPLSYKGILIDCAYRADFLIDDQLIVELKSVDSLAPIHTAQVLSYLKLSARRRALLINFNVPILTQGIRRISL